MMRRAAWVVVLLFVPAAWLGCTAGSHCDADDLTDALASAEPGDTVLVGVCTVAGRFTVPAGVVLHGEGPGRSVLATPASAADDALASSVIDVSAGTGEASVVDVTIDGTFARSALVVRGGGNARISRVHVEGGAAVGLGAEDVTSLRIADVTIDGDRGVVTLDAMDDIEEPRAPSRVGLAVLRAGALEMANVTVSRAGSGAWLAGSTTRWESGGAPQNAGAGIVVDGGDATLVGLDLSGTSLPKEGIAAALLFRRGATGCTTGLEIDGGAGLGIVLDGSGVVVHERPEIRGTRLAGIWAQSAPLRVSGGGDRCGRDPDADDGERAVVEGVAFAGIVAVSPTEVDLEAVTVRGVAVASLPVEGAPTAGDALHLVLGTERPRITLSDVVLAAADRAALLLDVRGEPPDVATDRVEIECAALAHSAVVQSDDTLAAWPGGPPDGGPLCVGEAPPMPFEVATPIDAAELPTAATLVERGLAGLEDEEEEER